MRRWKRWEAKARDGMFYDFGEQALMRRLGANCITHATRMLTRALLGLPTQVCFMRTHPSCTFKTTPMRCTWPGGCRMQPRSDMLCRSGLNHGHVPCNNTREHGVTIYHIAVCVPFTKRLSAIDGHSGSIQRQCLRACRN